MKDLHGPARWIIAGLLGSLWIGWGVWANRPHYYDARALQQEITQLFPSGPVPELEPAVGGFPIFHMRYEFKNAQQLITHEFSKDKFGLNVLLCVLATISVMLLVLQAKPVSRLMQGTIVILASALLIAYFIFGLPPLSDCLHLFPAHGRCFGRRSNRDDQRSTIVKHRNGPKAGSRRVERAGNIYEFVLKSPTNRRESPAGFMRTNG